MKIESTVSFVAMIYNDSEPVKICGTARYRKELSWEEAREALRATIGYNVGSIVVQGVSLAPFKEE